jgi:S-layer protein
LDYKGTTATTIDASATAGNFDWTAGALAKSSVVKGSAAGTNTIDLNATKTASTFVTYTGGSGDDLVDASSSDNNNVFALRGGNNDLKSGNGNNTVTLASDGVEANGNANPMQGNVIILGNGKNTVTDTGTKGAIITVGDGSNTITLGSGADFVTVGAGSNTITLGSGDDVVTVGAGLNTITLGAGADTVKVNRAVNENLYSTITDFALGDSLDFSVGPAQDGTLGAAITLAGTADFEDYLNEAASGPGNTLAWFQFRGNTFVVADDNAQVFYFELNAQGQAGNDSVVALTGLIDLTGAAFDQHGTLTFALA